MELPHETMLRKVPARPVPQPSFAIGQLSLKFFYLALVTLVFIELRGHRLAAVLVQRVEKGVLLGFESLWCGAALASSLLQSLVHLEGRHALPVANDNSLLHVVIVVGAHGVLGTVVKLEGER